MVKCDVPDCDEVIEYLPFKCRYCGGTFCKKHRLPENHNCPFTMEKKSSFSQNIDISQSSHYEETTSSSDTNYSNDESQLDREMRDYIRNQERSSMPPPPNRDSSRIRSFSSSLFGGSHRSKGTYWLMGLNGLFSLAGLILGLFRVSSAVLFLNVSTLFGNFWIWTLFTSMFTTTNVFSLIFTMIILYGTGRMLENQFGTRFILYLYIGCGLFGIVGGLFFQAIFSFLPILPQANALGFQLSLFSVQWAALLGMISYILYMVGLNREMRMYLYFIPIKMKGKYILYFLILMDLVFIVLGIFNPGFSQSAVESFAQICALAGGYFFFKKFGRRNAISRFI